MSINKKVSYISLLKEAVVNDPENDVSKTIDVKGPMIEPILGYDGSGELKTTQDAASILERYYFKDDTNDITSLSEEENPPEDGDPVEVGGQKEINKAKTDIVKAIEEAEELEDEDLEDDEEIKKDDEEIKKDDEEIEVNEFESAVLEKLIAEMENEEMEDEDKEKEDKDKEKLDVDKEKLDVDKEMEEGFVPGEKGTENTDETEINEMFQIFSEAIEEDDMDEEDVRQKIKKK